MDALSSLVVRARLGNMEAFGELVARFRDMAYGYAYSILGDFHLAEDAAQEAFIEAYGHLAELRDPNAFPGWLRRIVIKHCDRMTRGKRLDTIPLGAAAELAADQPTPEEEVAQREMRDRVLRTIGELPEHQREVTTLYYINGYSQNEIAQFLEKPLATVKKRLHDSRKKLRERMLDMVSETLRENMPDERFSRRVIQALLARPRPLKIRDHPLRQIVEAIRAALPEYAYFEGDEVIEKSGFPGVGPAREDVYHLDESRVLRRETTITTLRAAQGQKPPVRLLTAGRVFRPGLGEETPARLTVFHQVDALCIEQGVGAEDMKAALQRVLEAVLGPIQAFWKEVRYNYLKQCLEAEAAFGEKGQKRASVAGCGMLTADTLRRGGYDPDVVSGFAFGMNLERLAMLKLGLDDVRKLWQPPYVPQGAEA